MTWLGKKWSEERREQMSKAHLGKPSGNKGKKYPFKGRPTKGKSWSEVRRQAQIARNNAPYKSVLRVRTNFNMKSRAVIKNGREYNPLWHEIRKLVYKRDNYECQECGVHCRQEGKDKIQCHHIDYDITNNDLSNLITLCASCHCKTNFKRSDWIIRYSEKGLTPSNNNVY
jgi:hypothetical protein